MLRLCLILTLNFTPLEKATDKVGGGKNIDADPVRNKLLNGVRE